jgi:hypothetical protein
MKTLLCSILLLAAVGCTKHSLKTAPGATGTEGGSTTSSPNQPSPGHESGNGGGTLARLLSFSQNEIINILPLLNPKAVEFNSSALNNWYASSYGKMIEEVKSLRFQITSDTIQDSSYGYKTWIRIRQTEDFIVEYNPDVENYQRLAGIINLEHRHSGSNQVTPSISDVTEYLLHEIGHRYGLGEQDAWTFAQTIAPKFKFNKPLEPRTCRVYHWGQPGADKPTKIKVTTEFQTTRVGDFYLDYQLKPNSFLFEFTVYDKSRTNRLFFLETSADSRIYGGSDLSTGWLIACED